MLVAERRALIAEQLELQGSVRVGALSSLFGVTEETIRRDLEELEKQGILQRTYGGAVKPAGVGAELPFARRIERNVAEKQKIARAAKSLILPGDTLALDASTTVLAAAREFCENGPLTLLTNSVQHVVEFAPKSNITVICTGGAVRATSLSFVGPLAERVVSDHHVDKAVLSCRGITLERGVTDTNDLEVELKKRIIASAREVILLADHEKFGYAGFARLCAISAIHTLVTDDGITADWVAQIEALGPKVVVAR